jgi:hypothetical protein
MTTFKQWLLTEAIIDKEEFIKEINSTEHYYLHLQLSPDGKILITSPNIENDVIKIDKKHKSIEAKGSLQPLSKNFANVINTIKKIYPEILNYTISSTGVAGFRNPAMKNRTVQYWIDQQRTDPKANLPEYFYHGTSTNLYNMFIKEQGLVPRQISGSSGSYGASVKALSRGMFNYLTIHPDYATREAALQAARNHGGLPLILKINSHAIDPTRLFPDEDAKTETWEESMKKIGTVAYKGIIQNSSIIPYEISKDNNRFKWSPYEETPIMDHPAYENLTITKEHRNKDSIFFALYDKEIIDIKGNLLKSITSEEFNKIIKNAKWATNAWLIHESMKNGSLRHTYNNVISKSNFNEKSQKIVLDLYNNGILNDYLGMKSIYTWEYDEAIQSTIKYAKHLGKNSWQEIEQKLKYVYSRNYRDESDLLSAKEAKEILGITS